MTTATTRNAALVYATRAAQADARELLGECIVVERLVAHAIRKGRFWPKLATLQLHRPFIVELDQGLDARCVRVPGRERPEPWAWQVLRLRSQRKSNVGGARWP